VFRKWIAVLCLCYLALEMGIIWHRAPTWDEGWFASPPYSLLHGDGFGTKTIDPQGYLLRPPLTHIDQRTYWVLPLNLLAQTGWYAIFGFGLIQMRLLTALFGVLAIIALYFWTLKLTGRALIASLAALLLAQDNIFLWRSADGRMDMMCLSLGLIGQAVYLVWRESNLNRAVLSGSVFICLAGLTHPNGVISLLTFTGTRQQVPPLLFYTRRPTGLHTILEPLNNLRQFHAFLLPAFDINKPYQRRRQPYQTHQEPKRRTDTSCTINYHTHNCRPEYRTPFVCYRVQGVERGFGAGRD
jgi:hypothetical protein